MREYVKRYVDGMNDKINEWSDMRGCYMHSGRRKQGMDYAQSAKEMRELIEILILKLVDESTIEIINNPITSNS